MKRFVLAIICAFFALSGQSQINVGGVKGKVADKVKGATKTSSDQPEEKPKTQYAIDQENMKNSPAYQPIYDFRVHAPIALDEIKNKRYIKVDSAFLAGKLSDIRRLDPTWVDMQNDQATFDTIVKKCTPYWTEQRYYTRLDKVKNTSFFLREYSSSTKYYTLKEDDDIGKERYQALRSAYLQEKNQSERCLNFIREIDTFYATYPGELKAMILQEDDRKMKIMGSNTKDIRSNPEFITLIANNEIPFIDPANMTQSINEYQTEVRKAMLFMPEDPELTNIINKLETLKVDYAEYISSGDYEKNVPAVAEKRLDIVRCPKAVNTNTALIAVVKQDFATSAEKLLRTSITSSEWKVNKNSYGDVNDRTMVVYVVYTTPDGKCMLEEGELYCRYVGGKWENAKFHFIGREPREMLSKNAQK